MPDQFILAGSPAASCSVMWKNREFNSSVNHNLDVLHIRNNKFHAQCKDIPQLN